MSFYDAVSIAYFVKIDELVKSRKIGQIRRLRKKLRRQGARIMRNEAYSAYAAMTNDEVQRSIRTFYEAVKIGASSSGKTQDFGSCIRRFESSRPSQI